MDRSCARLTLKRRQVDTCQSDLIRCVVRRRRPTQSTGLDFPAMYDAACKSWRSDDMTMTAFQMGIGCRSGVPRDLDMCGGSLGNLGQSERLAPEFTGGMARFGVRSVSCRRSCE